MNAHRPIINLDIPLVSVGEGKNWEEVLKYG